MIKNRTYYKGKPKLKFERYPMYIGSTKLNKIHVNLLVTKLVSRVSTSELDVDLLKKIAELQDLEFKYYDFDDEGAIRYHSDKDGPDRSFTRTPCFTKKDDSGKEIWLSVDSVWQAYKSGRKTIEHGIDEVLDPSGNLIGHDGYSHRGGSTFMLGDKLFDPNWEMNDFHPDFKKYKKKMCKSKYCSKIEDVVPFSERGSKVIETLKETKMAARALSDYLG